VDDRRILFFGDSFVAGVGDPVGGGWVGRVSAASAAAGLPFLAYNLGIRHETSSDVVLRLRAEAAPRRAPEADCRLVLSVGANDTSVEDGRLRVQLERSLEEVAVALDEAAALGLPALVVGPPPLGDGEQLGRIEVLTVRLAELCAGRGVPFIGVTAPLAASEAWAAEAALGDGRHPAAGGYEELAQLVLAGGWLGWLRTTGPRAIH
jgi:lysophospholipase L1-like esterase